MVESTVSELRRRSTAHASLAALGIQLRHLDLFAPIRARVQIPQKQVKFAPTDKLYDAWLGILAGAKGVVEINRGLRADPALQAAFGRAACAEQSVIQDTLDACTPTTVAQMEAALDQIFRQHSRTARHDYTAAYLLLDVDMSGLPCGKKAALASKGYFAGKPNRRGRQLGRVLATDYGEVVVDRLFDGTTQLTTALLPWVEAAEHTLQLEAVRRERTILRVDAGGGSLAQVNAVLRQGYQYHGKDYSPQRAKKLAASVTTWIADPKLPGREAGWVTVPAAEYERPIRRLAVRCRKANGQWEVAVLLSTLSPAAVLGLTGQPLAAAADPQAVLWAYVYFYDARGGGVECSLKGDKQGLGITRRNKKRFAAQQMLVQLNALAHNVLLWAKQWLAPRAPQVAGYGIQRLRRDACGISGVVEWEPTGRVRAIWLNGDDPLARHLLAALQALLAPEQVAVNLGQT